MLAILPAASFFDQLVGQQRRINGQSYRLMTYVIEYPVNDGVLLYHTLTNCLLLLTHEEAAHITEQKELIDRWFLVPQQHDDRKLCQQVRSMAALVKPADKAISGYTILTTTGCNARCFYCYEKGTTPIAMTQDTADQVVSFIQANRGDKKVKVRWFGGEPLYNVSVIDRICSGLQSSDVPFRSSMISNGYLFDTDVVRRAKELWRLRNVQITLDGTEPTYNRVKHYIYNGGSAFERVLRNIGLLTAEDIRVSVRLNVGMHNAEDMMRLVTLLHERFGDNKHLSIYSHELFGENDPEVISAIYEARMRLEQLIADCGYAWRRKLQRDIKLNSCMADSDQNVVIAPDGHLGKCEHYIDSNFIGHIGSEERDIALVRRFKERPADIERCAACAFYPQCVRLVMCGDGCDCTPEQQKEHIYSVRMSMKKAYENYLNHQEQDDHEDEI